MKRSGLARRTKLAPKSGSPRARLLYECDELARIICMSDSGCVWVPPYSGPEWKSRTWYGRCPTEPRWTEGVVVMQWAHVIGRANLQLRHHPENAVALSLAAHKHFTHRPVEWRDWIADTYGTERWAKLEAMSRYGEKVNLPERLERLRAACLESAGRDHVAWAALRASWRGR